MNPFRKMKLKSKLRNCDYKLAGTVIKQQYYNDHSYTEINRMIDHFIEEPGFDRALDLIDYNDMIVFYFTESCSDGLYVRKAPIEPKKSTTQLDSNTDEEVHTLAEPASIQIFNDLHKEQSTHSEHLQTIQESEVWMDEMINRLARKPKIPTVATIAPTPLAPPVNVYTEDEVETFDTIAFKSHDSFKDIEAFKDIESLKDIEVFKEAEVLSEKENITVFDEAEAIKVIQDFHQTETVQEEVSAPEPSSTAEIHAEQEAESSAAFKFVASAKSGENWDSTETMEFFVTSPLPERPRKKRPSFPNVVATLKIDLHTMMKQLDEYRYQLAYHPHNEQQMISWIEALENAVDEFSSAIDLIEDSYE